MTREELIGLFDAGDLQGLLLAVGRNWLDTYYPDAEYASLVARLTDRLPCVVIPVLNPRRAASSSRPPSP